MNKLIQIKFKIFFNMHISYKRTIYSITALLILLAGLTFVTPAAAQSIESINFQNLQASDVSDQQLRELWERAQAQGYMLQELKDIAILRGMAPAEASKLVRRVRNLESLTQNNLINQQLGQLRSVTQDSLLDMRRDRARCNSRIFGACLFYNNENISFAPSLDIPTPSSYELGAGDQIIIDIWGATEETYRLQISPEGTIMLPRVGPVYLNGLAVEDARVRLKNELEDIYASLQEGRSQVRITLGNIRSIQVTVLGNVSVPGTYTVPSLTSAFNALYIAGGPDSTGTYRKIKIIRNGRVADTLDVYNFLVGGQQPGTILLRDQDIIKIGPYLARVELTGRTKRTGIFELKTGETIGDLIRFGGDFATGAYTKSITVVRETPTELKYINIQYPRQKGFVIQNGDSVHVGRISERVINRITIQGAVFREGNYALRDSTTVYRLIQRAGGLRQEAFLNRGLIFRERENMTTEVISFSPREVLGNPEEYDIDLTEDDKVVIKSIFELRDEYNIQVNGAVQDPGEYDYVYDMTLEEAILHANGFDQTAAPYRVNVARRITETDTTGYVPTEIVETYSFSVSENLELSARGSNFDLQPYDQVFVRSSPAYYEQQNVTVEGQVVYPGEYVLETQEARISDLVEQAGGLNRFAYPEGATLIRYIEQEQAIDTTLFNLADSLQATQEFARDRYQVGINLAEIMENPGSKYDLLLQEGDLLKIPKQLQTVRITGEVLRPVIVRYTEGRSFKDYIRAAGGATNNGERKDAYIVYANGEVDRANSFLFFRNYPEVKPGATIYVPAEEEKTGLSTTQSIGLFSTILTTLAIVYNAISQ